VHGCSGSVRPRPCRLAEHASASIGSSPKNIEVNRRSSMRTVIAIKLLRTDTTHDLSQKAEKGMRGKEDAQSLLRQPTHPSDSRRDGGLHTATQLKGKETIS